MNVLTAAPAVEPKVHGAYVDLHWHGLEISSEHRYGYRPGTWFKVLGLQAVEPRPGDPLRDCWRVQLEDRVDWWPVCDPHRLRGPALEG